MRIIFLKTLSFFVPLILTASGTAQTEYLRHRQAQLSSARALYNENMQFNFATLKNYLPPGHFRKLIDTKLYITLEDNIISAKAIGHTNNIQISAATILFLDELAITLAWYDSNGNTNYQPVLNYVLFLRKNMKKGKLEREIIPTMPEVLGVPSDELWERDDADPTKTFAQNFLKSAVTWILAHEMGHVALGHLDQRKKFSDQLEKARYNQELEMAADEFATELMARIRLAPIGMALSISYYSLLYPIRMEFEYEEDWQAYLANESHPIWPERLVRLARLFRQYGRYSFRSSDAFEYFVQSIERFAELLNSRDVLDAMILGAERLTLKNMMTFEPLKKLDKKYYLPRYER